MSEENGTSLVPNDLLKRTLGVLRQLPDLGTQAIVGELEEVWQKSHPGLVHTRMTISGVTHDVMAWGFQGSIQELPGVAKADFLSYSETRVLCLDVTHESGLDWPQAIANLHGTRLTIVEADPESLRLAVAS